MSGARTVAEIRAAMPAEFREQVDAIAAQANASRTAGPWRLYIPRPGSSRLWLHWSFATEAAARERLASFYAAIQQRAVIRYEEAL